MKTIDRYIKEIKENIDMLKDKHKKFRKTDLLVAYRGEPIDYKDTSLMPSLFRNDEYISKEAYLLDLFGDYNMVSNNASNVERAIEAQHYVAISRMLDISFNVLVALYFACSNEDENEDGYVYAFAFPEHYSPHSKYVEDFYTNILEGRHEAYSRNFKVFSHSYSNDRIKAQKGGFIFFPGKDYMPISECYYERITISKNDKLRILDDLDILFQINRATIFPEKDKIAQIIKDKFTKNNYLNRNVSIQDEVETYFSRINYELALRCYKEVIDKKYYLRFLRKEEKDLLSYIDSHESSQSKDELMKNVKENFNILRIMFMEAQDGRD